MLTLVALLLLVTLGWVAVALLLLDALGWVAITLLLLVMLGRTRPPPHHVRTVVVVVEAVVVGAACRGRGRGRDASLSSSIWICAVIGHQVLSIGGRCGGSTYVPLDISVRGQKTKTNHKISWFALLHWGICSPPHLFHLRRHCVLPPLPRRRHRLALYRTLPPSHPCFSSSLLCRPLDSPVVVIVASAFVAVWVSPSSSSPRFSVKQN